jgi:hypothetical protein
MMVLVLQFIPDNGQAMQAVTTLRNRMSKGSCMVIAHPTLPPEASNRMLERIIKEYSSTVTPINLRPKDEVLQFFQGMNFIHPGLVYTPLWRPEIADPYRSDELAPLDKEPYRALVLAGVGEC